MSMLAVNSWFKGRTPRTKPQNTFIDRHKNEYNNKRYFLILTISDVVICIMTYSQTPRILKEKGKNDEKLFRHNVT